MTDENLIDDASLRLTAVDQVPFIMAVCEGPELRVLSLSAATRAVLPGRPWQGRPIREVISDLTGQQVADAYYEVYRTGVPITGQEWRVHLDMPDGSVHEMWANFTITPWLHDGERRGVIGIGFDVTEAVRARQADAERTARLQRQVSESREVVSTLQRELLPAGLPVLPGVQIAAAYLLADGGTVAGGDWFDTVTRPDGRVVLIVGDVVGHGVTASGVMGQLRAVLQERLDAGSDTTTALAAADRFAHRLPAAHAATVCLAELDPASGALTYCTAGHPPPLIVTAQGEIRRLPGTGGVPLGTGGSFPVLADRLEDGDMLLLFTDGLIERPGRNHPDSLAEIAHVAADVAAGRALQEPAATVAERVCAQTIEMLVRATGHADDVTVLAAQRVTRVRDLDLELAPEPAALRPARAELGAWLDDVGATEQDVFVVQHALGELMTNAIEHQTSGRPITVRVSLGADGRVRASVRDRGNWVAPSREPRRGRGLAITAQLVDSLTVVPSDLGTLASIEHTLIRPARMIGAMAAPAALPTVSLAEEEPLVIEDLGDETRVRISGAVDALTAGHLTRDLLRRGRGGTAGLTVDLSGVTHLSSAGVAALFRVVSRHEEQKAPLALHALPGTVAQHILDLVALPYAATAPELSTGAERIVGPAL